MTTNIREISLPIFENSNGKLLPIEFFSAVPFEVMRTYFIWAVPLGTKRGGHAHTKEKEVFICLRGRCNLYFSTDGKKTQKIPLQNPQKAIFVDNLVWHEFSDFSPDALLLAFSSTKYLPENYISSFDDFAKIIQK